MKGPLVLLLLCVLPTLMNGKGNLRRKLQETETTFPVVTMPFDDDNLHYGFTNQIILLGQLLRLGCFLNRYVIAPAFRLEIGTHAVGSIDLFIDVKKTNKNLNCTQILPAGTKYSNEMQYTAMQLSTKYNWAISQQVKHLVLADSLIWYPKEERTLPDQYYGVHLRLEMDWIIFQSKNGFSYFHWLGNLTTNSTVTKEVEDEILLSQQ